MQKLSLRNLSFLGLALMAVSALTAAFTSSKSTDRVVSNGSIRPDLSNDGGVAVNTCVASAGKNSCNATAGSETTVSPATNSLTVLGGQTANNTTVGDI